MIPAPNGAQGRITNSVTAFRSVNKSSTIRLCAQLTASFYETRRERMFVSPRPTLPGLVSIKAAAVVLKLDEANRRSFQSSMRVLLASLMNAGRCCFNAS